MRMQDFTQSMMCLFETFGTCLTPYELQDVFRELRNSDPELLERAVETFKEAGHKPTPQELIHVTNGYLGYYSKDKIDQLRAKNIKMIDDLQRMNERLDRIAQVN